MRALVVALCAACSSPAPHHPLSNDTSVDIAKWHPRRPLPASPNLADVVCLDPKGSIVLDVVANPARPTVTVTPPDHMSVCASGTCRTIPYAKSDDRYANAVTDGVHVALGADQQTNIYRVSDGQHLYRLINTTSENRDDAEEFSCGVADLIDDVILADGHDCEGPAAAPFLADVATGKTLAMLPFANNNGASSIELRALRMIGSRYALVMSPFDDNTCEAAMVDIHTGAILESIQCTPAIARVVGTTTIPFTPVACPATSDPAAAP